MAIKCKSHPWLLFLQHRADVIDWFLEEGKTFEYIAETLSMTAQQVQSIAYRNRSGDLIVQP